MDLLLCSVNKGQETILVVVKFAAGILLHSSV